MRIEFGFGVGYDRDHRPLDREFVRLAVKTILVNACELFGGCNLLSGQGAWIDGTGTLILEESRVLVVDCCPPPTRLGGGAEFDTETERKVAALAEFIRAALRQEAVHVVKMVATARNIGSLTEG